MSLSTLFVKKRQNIIYTTLYSFSGPFQALQADRAYISFLARSAVDPKFCFLFVDLFTSKIYNDINKKRDGKIRLQTDREFKQRTIFELNKKFDVKIYCTNLGGGKEKFKGKRTKPNELIKKATFNLNHTRSAKYGYSPQQIEEQALDSKTGKYFQEVFDFDWLIQIKENRDWLEKFNAIVDRRKKRLREPLDIDVKVIVLAEHLRKKTLQENYTNAQPKAKLFLTKIKF